MRRTAAVCLVVGLAALCRASDGDTAASALRAILRPPDPSLPSRTKRVRDLLSGFDRSNVLRAEREAWDVSGHSTAVESLISFLHDFPAPVDNDWRFRDVGGAIVLRPPSGSHDGLQPWQRSPRLMDAIRDAPLRAVPAPDADALFAEAARGVVGRLSAEERADFGMALGEACGADEAALRRLLVLADSGPIEDHVAYALGWSRSPAAVSHLDAAFAALSTRYLSAATRDDARSPLAAVEAALVHAAPALLDGILAKLPPEDVDRLVALLGPRELVARRIRRVRDAVTPDAKRAALLRLLDTGPLDECAVAGSGASADLFETLAACLESPDEELRTRAVAAAEWFVNGGTFEDLCLLSGAADAIRALLADARQGVLVLGDDDPPADEPPSERRFVERVQPDVRTGQSPDATRRELAIRIEARMTEEGLRTRLRNVGTSPFSLLPSDFRLGRVRVLAREEGDRVAGVSVQLGHLACSVRARARSLVVVPPGSVHDVVIPLSERFRTAGRVEVTLLGIPVIGAATAPPVSFFAVRVL